jgi:Phage tail lysozyme
MSDFTEYAGTYVGKFAKDLRITPVQAAGIVGNFGHESGLVPGIQEVGARPPAGGVGWGQWTGARRGLFEAWCRERRERPNSVEANYGFAVHELIGSYAHVVAALRGCHSIAAAASVFEKEYEMAGVVNLGSRIALGNEAFELYEKEIRA